MKPARFDLRGFLRFSWRWLVRTPWSPRRVLVAGAFYLVFPWLAVVTWTGLALDNLLFPGFRRQRIESPLFIVGNPRSGTTFLHRLLARDRRFTTLAMWQILFAPSVTARKVVGAVAALDRRWGKLLHRRRERIEESWHELNVMHRVSLDEPEEDDYLLLHIWSALTTGLSAGVLDDALPYTRFDSSLPPERRHRIFEFYRRCLQRHLHASGAGDGARGPAPRYLAKNPALCPKLATVFEHFPDAQVVYLVRNPLEMIPSYLSMMEFSWRAVGLPTERRDGVNHGDGDRLRGDLRAALREYLLAMAAHWYRHPLAVLDRAPEGRACVVRYDDLVNDPDATVRRIYRELGLEVDAELAEVLRQATARAQRYRSRHDYSLEELGLTRERVVAELSDVFARFGFDTEV